MPRRRLAVLAVLLGVALLLPWPPRPPPLLAVEEFTAGG